MLITWREEGEWRLLRSLIKSGNRVTVFQPLFSGPGRNPLLRKLFKWTCDLYLPLAALLTRNRFDIVLSWSMRMAVVFGVLNRLAGARVAPAHIMRDLHFNLERNDWRYRLRIVVFRMAIPGIDFFLCTSREEERIYRDMFGISPDRISFFPDAPPSRFVRESHSEVKGQYIFSYGNSDRDFNTLIEAVRGINSQCLILSQTFRTSRELPSNVKVLRDFVSEDDLIRLVNASSMVVLPLRSYRISAGQNTMLETLALGHPLLAARNMATCEYAEHGVSAFFFDAGDARDLSAKILFIIENQEMARSVAWNGKAKAAELLDQQTIFLLALFRYIL